MIELAYEQFCDSVRKRYLPDRYFLRTLELYGDKYIALAHIRGGTIISNCDIAGEQRIYNAGEYLQGVFYDWNSTATKDLRFYLLDLEEYERLMALRVVS